MNDIRYPVAPSVSNETRGALFDCLDTSTVGIDSCTIAGGQVM